MLVLDVEDEGTHGGGLEMHVSPAGSCVQSLSDGNRSVVTSIINISKSKKATATLVLEKLSKKNYH